MKITWYGHAAFSIEGHTTTGEARKVILDPYNYPDAGGYRRIDDTADIVCISHDNVRYHSDVSAINGEFELLEAMEIVGGSRDILGVNFEAFEVYEDAERQGPNGMVKFSLDGITVAHQGDLGHALEGPALEFLEGVDVLLALAGGPPTIELDDLVDLIEKTRPALVLPMHYKTPKINLNLATIDHFLLLCENFEVESTSSVSTEIAKENLPDSTRILTLQHAR